MPRLISVVIPSSRSSRVPPDKRVPAIYGPNLTLRKIKASHQIIISHQDQSLVSCRLWSTLPRRNGAVDRMFILVWDIEHFAKKRAEVRIHSNMPFERKCGHNDETRTFLRPSPSKVFICGPPCFPSKQDRHPTAEGFRTPHSRWTLTALVTGSPACPRSRRPAPPFLYTGTRPMTVETTCEYRSRRTLFRGSFFCPASGDEKARV